MALGPPNMDQVPCPGWDGEDPSWTGWHSRELMADVGCSGQQHPLATCGPGAGSSRAGETQFISSQKLKGGFIAV